jgi:hypothetical protein
MGERVIENGLLDFGTGAVSARSALGTAFLSECTRGSPDLRSVHQAST